ncbi:helix-turn-helix domain-containing protein [Zoogloea oleivorans]|uniref:helix-turn-helix domain-containing protein n=1 Tax=Zoogloea oleivorans TaxID=1552750 RepID=UPI00387E12D9
MQNHPNPGPKGPSANPAPAEIRAAREAAGLTQSQAAALIHSTLRTWQDWEAGKARRPAHLMLRETPAFRPGRKGAQPTGCTSV